MFAYNYSRRNTRGVKVGNMEIGGAAPILVQSMTNTSTLDTEGSAQQAMAIAEAGGELVRLTTQGVREAANLQAIKDRLKELGCDVPLSADVHFNPQAAFEAALHAGSNTLIESTMRAYVNFTPMGVKSNMERPNASITP